MFIIGLTPPPLGRRATALHNGRGYSPLPSYLYTSFCGSKMRTSYCRAGALQCSMLLLFCSSKITCFCYPAGLPPLLFSFAEQNSVLFNLNLKIQIVLRFGFMLTHFHFKNSSEMNFRLRGGLLLTLCARASGPCF